MSRFQIINDMEVEKSGDKYAGPIEDFKKLDESTILVRKGIWLICYRSEPGGGSLSPNWIPCGQLKLYPDTSSGKRYMTQIYPWIVTNKFFNKPIVAIRHFEGLRFYSVKEGSFVLLAEDVAFNVDTSGRKVFLGEFYVPQKNALGIMIRDVDGETSFFGVLESELDPKNEESIDVESVASELDVQLVPEDGWGEANSEVFITKLDFDKTQDSILLRTSSGIQVYKFDEKFKLQKTLQFQLKPGKPSTERLFFGNVTQASWQDVVQFDQTGLTLYQYQKSSKSYRLVASNENFSEARGWTAEHWSTVRIVDIDGDGISEIVSNGPAGLSALKYQGPNTAFANILAETSQSSVVGVIESTIFLQGPGQTFNRAKISVLQQPSTTTTAKPMPTSSTARPPKTIVPASTVRKDVIVDRKWLEQWSPAQLFKNAVDLGSGQLGFNVPIVNLLDVSTWSSQIYASYSSQSHQTDFLGQGWSISLAQDLIFLDKRQSIFPTEYKWYMLSNGKPTELECIKTDGDLQHFRLEKDGDEEDEDDEDSKITIVYSAKKKTWVVENQQEKNVYGAADVDGAADAFQWSLEWPNWSLSATDVAKTRPVVTTWFLNRRFDKARKIDLFYFYDEQKASLQGSEYTSEMLLSSIEEPQRIKILFSYGKKTFVEYKEPKLVDMDGKIHLPSSLINRHFLDSCTMTAKHMKQTFKFEYLLTMGETRLLKSINQILASGMQETILELDYTKFLKNHVLTSLKSGGLTFKYDFEEKTAMSPLVYHDNAIKYLTRDIPILSIGPDYTVLAYKNFDADPTKNAVALKILNRQMTRTDTTLYASNLSLTFENFSVEAYKAKIVVFAQTEDQKLLLTFLKNKKKWSQNPSRLLLSSSDSEVYLTEDIVVVRILKSPSLSIYNWNNEANDWVLTTVKFNSHITNVIPSRRFLIVSDDTNLNIVYPTEGTSWTKRILSENPYKVNNGTINKFDTDDENRTEFRKAVDAFAVLVEDNIVTTTSFEEKNGQLQLTHRFYLLNAQFQLMKEQTFVTLRDRLSDVTQTNEMNGTTIKIGYLKNGKTFQTVAVDIWGKGIEEIDKLPDAKTRAEQKEKVLKTINKGEPFKKNMKRNFLLFRKLRNYLVQMTHQGLRCGEDGVLYGYTGDKWVATKEPATTSWPLGTKHFLEVSNWFDGQDFRTAKLYDQTSEGRKGHLLETIKFKGEYILRYPAYLAFQKTMGLIDLLLFDSDEKLEKARVFPNEIILGSSDHQNLITFRNNTSTDQLAAYECVVRPTSTLSPKPQMFVRKMTVSDGTAQRHTGYKRAFEVSHTDMQYIETATLIPGGDETISGRYEASRILHVPSGNITTSEKWFDASRTAVLPPIQKKEKARKKVSKDEIKNYRQKFQLMDSGNSLMIALTTPFDLDENLISYYGFEFYEKNQIGNRDSNRAWTMTNAEIVPGQRALTGDSFLQLKPTDTSAAKITGVFVPQSQYSFIFSAWIRRTDGASFVGQTQEALRIQLRTSEGLHIVKLHGSVKRRLGEWAYVELLLHSETILQIFSKFIEYKKKMEPHVEFKKTLEFVAEIEAPSGTAIDVDHIKFTPFPLDMDVNVYDENRKLTAVIKPDGRIRRTVYNRNLQEIAAIDEYGQITRLKTGSSPGSLGDIEGAVISNPYASSIILEPDTGHLEAWCKGSFGSNWLLDVPDGWNTSRNQLRHASDSSHVVQSAPNLFDSESAALRFYLHIEDTTSSVSLIWRNKYTLKLARHDASTKLAGPAGTSIQKLPNSGEILAFADTNSLWLWFDGVLLLDSESFGKTSDDPWAGFRLEVKGRITFEDLFVLNKPQLTIQYSNSFGDNLQVIKYEDVNSVLVTETLFDKLGRDAITTKSTRVKRDSSKPLLAFYTDFVTNDSDDSLDSVWKTGNLMGLASDLNKNDNGAPFLRTSYAPNPLNQEAEIGLPGQKYTIGSKYSTKINFDSDIALIHILFPPKQGFQHTTELAPSGTKKITIFNNRGLQVASYSKTPGYDHLLSTNEYDDQDRLVKILPPLYHEYVNTTKTFNPKLYQVGEAHLTSEERDWQDLLATWYTYDEYDRLIRKVAPDTGVTEFLYDTSGQQRLMVFLAGSDAKPQSVIFFDYDNQKQMVATGTLSRPQPSKELKKVTASTISWAKLPNQLFQSFDYSEDLTDPLQRGKIKHCITKDGYTVVADTFVFDSNGKLVKRGTTSDAFTEELTKLSTFKREYHHDLQKSIKYPITVDKMPLQIYYSYNRLGQLTGLGTEQDPTKYMAFAYLPTGELAEERFWPGTSGLDFTREFSYNSPGLLEKITDPFMTEDIFYEHGGYAQEGYGGGLVMKTKFNASWASNADDRWFRVQVEDIGGDFAESCHEALKTQGYLSGFGEPIKEYKINSIDNMPIVCTGRTGHKIATAMALKRRPAVYGHQYAYGSHQELIKAKYFTEADEHLAQPLRPTTFASDLSIPEMQSELIWNSLKASNHISSDQRLHDPATAIGGRGLPLVDRPKLLIDLKNLDIYYAPFFLVIEKYLLNNVGGRKLHNSTDFEETFLRWDNVLPTSPLPIQSDARKRAAKLADMLKTEDYIPVEASGFLNGLANSFTNALESFTPKIPEIVKVLSSKFNLALGESPFDLKCSEIDANGNHRLFYSAFKHHKLEYHKGKNQVKKIKSGIGFPFERSPEFAEISKIVDTVLKPSEYSVTHDTRGNVVRASHKGISKIVYHPVSQRPMDILKTDGTRLVFMYDAKGERILKRVFSPEGSLSLAKFYLRDETGQVVVDHEVHYHEGSSPIILTSAYIYGPRGLLGFWRNNKFYSVFTDNVGSTRLVIHKGRVVASYDYMPYGDLMRSFGPSDPEVHISYRFTGQEWDSETGLYNFHARLYDPSIGRFFQPDPKSQYFSPYVYGGNSPLAGADPDGEFFFTLFIIIGAVVGAYLGGVAANKGQWNLFKWDWKNANTYFGIIGGAIGGALLPVGFVASVKAIAAIGLIVGLSKTTAIGVGAVAVTLLGVGGSYLSAATKFGWDPAKWDWKDGRLYNELFTGFATGSGLAGGINQVHSYAGTISSLVGRGIFVTASYGTAGFIAYVSAVAANGGNWDVREWKWNEPGTWNALLNGFDAGKALPQSFYQMGKGAIKIFAATKIILKSPDLAKIDKLLQVLKNAKHGAAKTAGALVMGYYMGASANGDFDISKWSNDWSTYQNVLGGVFYGKEFSNTLALAKRSITKPSVLIDDKVKSFYVSSAKQFKSILGNFESSKKNAAQTTLIRGLFVASAVGRQFLLQGLPDPVQQEVEKFILAGRSRFEQGASPVPPQLHKHFNSLIQAETATPKFIGDINVDQLIKDMSAINIVDANTGFLTCRNSSRRKRAVQNCLGEKPESRTYLELDYTETAIWNRDFQADPSGFMSRNVVSSSYVDSHLDGPRNHLGKIQLDAGLQEFLLARSGDQGGFLFIPADDAPSKIRSEAFKAWYVPTGSSLLIPQPGPSHPRIIITDELNGSTVYYRAGINGTLEVYHHNRERQLSKLRNGNFVVFNNQRRFQLINWQSDPEVQTHFLQQIFHNIKDKQSLAAPAEIVLRCQDSSGRLPNNPAFGYETYSRAISTQVYSDDDSVKATVVTYWDNSWKAATNRYRVSQQKIRYPQITSNLTGPTVVTNYKTKGLELSRVEPSPPTIEIPDTVVPPAVDADIKLLDRNHQSSSMNRRRRRSVSNSAPYFAKSCVDKSSWFSNAISWIPTWSLPGSEDHNSNNNNSSARPMPSVLEMGDSLLNSADWYGNLTWASLLISKFTGQKLYSPPPTSNDLHSSTLISLKAADIVEGFLELVNQVAQDAGFEHDVDFHLDYFQLVNQVKAMVRCHRAEEIHGYLLETLSQSLTKALPFPCHTFIERLNHPEFLETVKQLIVSKDT